MAIINLVPIAGQTATTPFNTQALNSTQLAAGAHTLNLLDGNRLLTSNQDFAIGLFNPASGGGYAATATFTFTANISGIVANSGSGSAGMVLMNHRSVAPNKIVVAKTGAIGGDNVGIYATAVTNIDNNGAINSGGVIGEVGSGSGIIFDSGDPNGSNLKAATVLTINNNVGAAIVASTHGIANYSFAKLIINNKGFLIGGDSTRDNEQDGTAILSFDGTVVLLNELNSIVSGTVRTGWLNSSVTNKGTIEGTVKAHMFTEEDPVNEEHGLTGYIDYDRDGTPAKLDTGDKHLNNVVEIAMTVTNSGIIRGNEAWEVDQFFNPIQVALDLTHGKDKVINTGRIEGDVWTRSGDDVLDNSVTGKIFGNVDMGTSTFYTSINAYANDLDTVLNKGLIAGSVWTGIGKDTVTNNGEIMGRVETGTGRYDAANGNGEDADTLINTGAIRGNVWMGLGDDTVTNSGTINDGLDTSAWAPGEFDSDPLAMAYVWQNDTSALNGGFDNDKDKVTNSGTIRFYIGTGHGADTVTNTGTVLGSIETGVYATRGRSGEPNEPFAAVDQSVFQADDNDIVTNSGLVDGEIWTGLGADSVTNSGTTGSIATSSNYTDENGDPRQFYDQDNPTIFVTSELPANAGTFDKDIVTNSGIVLNEIWTGVGDDKVTNALTGRVGEGIYAHDGADIIDNLGYVNGDVHGGRGGDKITNSGVINHNVFLGIDSAINILINKKTINGSVAGDYGPTEFDPFEAAQGNNTVENTGVILGDITLGTGSDTVKNLLGGRIEGLITLGAGIDTFLGNVSNEYILDGDGADNYNFGAGNDLVRFEALSPTQQVDGDVDIIDGGLGVDTIEFEDLTANANVNLSNALAQTISWSGASTIAHIDTLKNFENIDTGDGNDTIVGSIGQNYINAGDGTNSITGGGGQDLMSGGIGIDTYFFNALTDSAPGFADLIFDFDAGMDKLNLTFIGTFVEASNFTVGSLATAQWRSTVVGGQTVFELNTDADAAVEFTLYFEEMLGAFSSSNLL